MKAIVITPPSKVTLEHSLDYKIIFLAGSIDMGKAEDWQAKIIEAVKDYSVIIANPRREDWDEDWEQSINNIKFKEQVEWELRHLEKANKVVMVLTKDSIAPISLLEFGLYARSGKLVIYCPDGYWRKGNIDIVCERYDIPQVEKFEELITLIKYA